MAKPNEDDLDDTATHPRSTGLDNPPGDQPEEFVDEMRSNRFTPPPEPHEKPKE